MVRHILSMKKFKVKIINQKPIIEAKNGHIRMVTGYKDKKGEYHIFCDFINEKYKTIHSWQGEIKYYKGYKLTNLKDMGILIKKDSYGIGSPSVTIYNNQVYIFYAKRNNLKQFEKFNPYAKPKEKGYISSDIYVNIYECDKDFAINTKSYNVYEALKRDNDWKSMRIDDPYPIVIRKKLYIYYKGFDDNTDKSNICIAYGKFLENKIVEEKVILKSKYGYEMPRVFIKNNRLNMFVRTFNNNKSSFRHYIKRNNKFIELQYDFFNGHPNTKAKDTCFIKDYKGKFTKDVIACGFENNKLKQWLYGLL